MNNRVLVTLFLAIFTTTLGVGIIVPILPIYAEASAAGGMAIGLIFGSFSLSRTLFVPIFGRLSDRKGRKPFITAGLFAYCLISIAFTLSDNVYYIVIVRFLQGVSSAVILPVAWAYVGELSTPEREGRLMGVFQLSMMGGLSFGPILGGIVNDTLGVRATFYSMGLFCFLGFLLSLLFLPSEKGTRRGADKRGAAYMSLLKDRTVLTLCIHRVCLACSIGAIWAFLPLLADKYLSLSSTSIGIVLMLNTAGSALLLYPMGVAADRYDKRYAVIIGGVVAAFAVFSLVYARNFTLLLTAGLAHGIALGAVTPSVMAVAVIAGRENNAMGAVMGLVSMAHSLGMLIGPVVSGAVVDLISFPWAFIVGGGALLIGTVIFMAYIPARSIMAPHKRALLQVPDPQEQA